MVDIPRPHGAMGAPNPAGPPSARWSGIFAPAGTPAKIVPSHGRDVRPANIGIHCAMSDSPYTIDRASNSRRKAVEEWLWGLDLVSPEVRDRIVTAWVSAWSSSPYEDLAEMPFQAGPPFYPLAEHVNEVTRAGVDLARRAAADWGVSIDWDTMVSILVLHDVDKPLLYRRDAGEDGQGHSRLFHELPHGVVGAMLLKDLGFPHRVVSTVATHATNAPFHGNTVEAHVLHYADLFAADHAMRVMGKTPIYLRRG
ncbi:hypothetical protein GCM10010964_14180 [Caldovatus sediminis]|uniref:HD domain-containing protein n=1 Tax=Caldovatus sediminis TaxID=2041189 RepID=A0A8J3EBJ4_9PROT|nr:hypothetical protein [Caldovatus sediminis]GGG27392.1 hypothetical protein GCM10010964_14180 [Caldovatus sediminis]